ATFFDINKVHKSTVPIGKPLSNTQIYILGESLELLPVGVVGELCIGGAGLARGYLNQPELTREKFVENPYRDGDRMYRTGDLARWLPDGNIEFIGRKDHQVKIRGYRIELEEIEFVIEKSGLVKQVSVLVRFSEGDNKQIVAYIIPNSNYDDELLRKHLRDVLPSYMIPSILIGLDEFPLTMNGKIDKKALQNMEHVSTSDRKKILPRNDIEERLANIWKDILGLNEVFVGDSFFDFG